MISACVHWTGCAEDIHLRKFLKSTATRWQCPLLAKVAMQPLCKIDAMGQIRSFTTHQIRKPLIETLIHGYGHHRTIAKEFAYGIADTVEA